MRVVVLSGGVGGARFASGVASLVGQENLTVIVNVGDDVDLLGLRVSPDLDIVTYTLAGLVDEEKGWGFAGDTFNLIQQLRAYGFEVWMKLGDRDLATHLYRTLRLREGATLSEVTNEIRMRLGVKSRILPVTNDRVTTMVELEDGRVVSFEEYFVKLGFRPGVRSVVYKGCGSARPAPGVLEEIQGSDAVIIGPSNPIASIMPILCVKGVRRSVMLKERVAAVTPIVGGRALKGPADKMMRELGLEASVLGVAKLYKGVASLMVIDEVDSGYESDVRRLGFRVVVTDTLMKDAGSRLRLARTVLNALGLNLF